MLPWDMLASPVGLGSEHEVPGPSMKVPKHLCHEEIVHEVSQRDSRTRAPLGLKSNSGSSDRAPRAFVGLSRYGGNVRVNASIAHRGELHLSPQFLICFRRQIHDRHETDKMHLTQLSSDIKNEASDY